MEIKYFQWFELLAFLSSLIFFKSLKDKKISVFTIFLGLTVCTEVLAANWLNMTDFKRTDIVYNIYQLLSTPMKLYIFYRVLELEGLSTLIFKLLSALVMTLALINFFIFQGPYTFNNYFYIFNQVIEILFSIIILFKIATNDDKDINFLNEPFFWIFGGGLLFSLGTLVVIGLREFILFYDLQLNGKHIYKVIVPILIVILYSSYSYGFFLCSKKTK